MNSAREGKFISVESLQGQLVCGKNTKWKTCPKDWISYYTRELLDTEQSITVSTADISSSSSTSSDAGGPIELFEDVDLDTMNAVRSKSGVHLLRRSPELDGLAKWHVRRMAKAGRLMHSEPSQVVTRMEWGTKKLGENISRGRTFQMGYDKMMEEVSNYSNVVDAHYTHMGMATTKGKDGKIYICQLFRG